MSSCWSGGNWAISYKCRKLAVVTRAFASSLKEIVRQETERVEREMIQRALAETAGNVTQAARALRISRKSLQTKMKELGLRDEKT